LSSSLRHLNLHSNVRPALHNLALYDNALYVPMLEELAGLAYLQIHCFSKWKCGDNFVRPPAVTC
jgi:hypothetical protein